MNEWACRKNIELFRTKLAEATDEQQVRVLRQLLAEEEARLARFIDARDSDEDDPSQR